MLQDNCCSSVEQYFGCLIYISNVDSWVANCEVGKFSDQLIYTKSTIWVCDLE